LRIFSKRLIATLRQGLLAAFTSLAAFLPFAGSASAEPALWVVRDADSTVYLFGTIHLMKPEMDWRSDKITKALQNSDDLWLELADGTKFEAQQAQLWKFGKDPAHPLSTKLTPDERKRLREAAKQAGVPPVSLESLRPWLAAIVLSTAPMEKAGYKTEFGIDNQLRKAALAADKPVKGLETVEQQFEFLAGMPPEMELAMLAQTIDAQSEGVAHLDQLAGAWLIGDVDKLSGLLKAEIQDLHGNDFYNRLLVNRNKTWSKQIAKMMQQPGTHFIAVGAAHLAGEDSVQAMLQKHGLTVARH
jgi:uncharacterized protein